MRPGEGQEDCEPEESRKPSEKYPVPSEFQMEACYRDGLPEVEVLSPILLSLPCKVWDALREPPPRLRPPAPAAPCPKTTLKFFAVLNAHLHHLSQPWLQARLPSDDSSHFTPLRSPTQGRETAVW